MRCTIGLGKWGSCIAWREERESEKRRNLCGGEGEKDERGRNRWQVVQPKIWKQSSWGGGGWWRHWWKMRSLFWFLIWIHLYNRGYGRKIHWRWWLWYACGRLSWKIGVRQPARSSRITSRASVQGGKDKWIRGRGSNLKCLPGWVSRERQREFWGQREGRKIEIWGNWAVDAKKLVVRDRNRNGSVSAHASVQSWG